MSNFNSIQRKLSEGLYAWMLYEFSCNKAYIFNEKYISYPIANILNNNTNNDQHVLVEQNHPLQNNSQGRPIQVDFVIKNKYDKTSQWEFAIETKWIGNSDITLTDFIWDLIRLQNLFSTYPNVKCYFLIAGNHKKIINFIENNSINKNDASKKIISSGTKGTILKLRNLKDTDKNNINDKSVKYKKFKLFSKINCGTIYQYPKENIYNMSFGTFLIEVLNPNIEFEVKSL